MERLCSTVRLRAGGASGAELEGSADLSTNSQSVQGNISALCSSYNENRLSFGIDLQRPLLLAPLLDPSDQLLERGMAVFMLNICKFNNCGLTFQNLGDLIQHIEDNHIDYDPQVIEEKEHEQPSCLPLSYVLRFFTDAARREVLNIKPKLKSMVEKPVTQPQQTATFNGNEADDDIFSESEDSNDSWSTQEEFSSEFILKYGSKMVSPTTLPDGTIIEKPFACPVPGCKKRYKNVNGIKYHSKNGHKNEGKIRKGFKCYCGKSYKTNGGLKNHTALMHSGTTMTTIATQNGTPQVLQIPTLQPIRTLTLKHIASLGLPVKTLVVATKSQDKTAKTTSSLGVLTPVTSPDSPEKPTEIVLSDN